jgi:dipeptidase D
VKSAIEGLEPELVWKHFYEISQIPRESGNEAAVGEYIISLAQKNALPYRKDELGNIIVSCPASKSREDRPMVVLQGHTDMVCEKNKDTTHDFKEDPIKLIREGDWIHADGTTLGSDNGIGISCAMALMEDRSLEHPALELLFTVDEETGLTGATGLQPDFVKSRILINLDSEEEGAFYIGCAGGKHTILRRKIEWKNKDSDHEITKIKVGGLQGGHSGLNIHQGLGNSIKLLSRFLYNLHQQVNFNLVSFTGGNKHNAIPREAEAVISLPAAEIKILNELVSEMDTIYKSELQFVDKDIYIQIEDVDSTTKVFTPNFSSELINLLYAMPHGVMAMSHTVEGLVETSTNMAVIETKNESIEMLTSQRSSRASCIDDIANKIKALGELAGFEIEQGGGYPAWEPNPESPLLKNAIQTYEDLYQTKPEVKVVHAGLECGIIGEKYPGMDMISFGPTIQGAHSPDEKVLIPAVENCWKYLNELLKKM